MRTFDALWIDYQAETNPTWIYEYQAVIDGQTYTQAEIWDFGKSGGLTANNFGIGNSPIQQFSISVLEKTGVTVPKNAKIEPYARITGADGSTAWHRLGVFFIESRKRLDGGKLQFDCLDRMAYADVPYLTDGETLENYPMPMDTAMNRIYTQLGTTLDSRSTISHTYTIDYPNDMTMRQVMAYIACAHGGNFCITDEDYLRLVVPGYTGNALAAIDSSNAAKTYAGNAPITWDSVSMVYSEKGDYFTSGSTHDAELEVTNPWATQAICDAVQTALNGYTYTPYTAEKADLDPAMELGDYITIDGKACNLWAWKWDTRLYCNISIPSSTDTTTSEFGYTGTLAGAISKKVTLGADYYGTIISRTEGLKITRSDGKSEVLLNALTMAMRALDGGVMVDKLYFDPVAGTFIFNGRVSANCIVAGLLQSTSGSTKINLDDDTFSMGNGALNWDGSQLTVNGSISDDSTDPECWVKIGNLTLDEQMCRGLFVYVKDYSSANPLATLAGGVYTLGSTTYFMNLLLKDWVVLKVEETPGGAPNGLHLSVRNYQSWRPGLNMSSGSDAYLDTQAINMYLFHDYTGGSEEIGTVTVTATDTFISRRTTLIGIDDTAPYIKYGANKVPVTYFNSGLSFSRLFLTKGSMSDNDEQQLRLGVTGGTNGMKSGIRFDATFENIGDKVARRCADIWVGYTNAWWGTETINFGAGYNWGSSNDGAYRSQLQMRIWGTGVVDFIRPAVCIRRGWDNYPCISVYNSTAFGPQGEFRFEGTPGESGGDFSVNVRADGSFINGSDRRRKTNIEQIPNALDKVKRLRGVAFNTVTRDLTVETTTSAAEGKKLGFIAQEAMEVIPEAVTFDPAADTPQENGWASAYGVDYGSITALLVEAIKEQQVQIEELKAQIATLQAGA